jgi:hypothetical protein
MNTYHKEHRMIPYHLIRKNNKNAYFRIKEGILHVTAHPKTSIKVIEAFIEAKFDVFYQKIQESNTKEADHMITLWGKSYEIILTRGRFSFEIGEDVIYVKTMSEDAFTNKKRIYKETLAEKLKTLKPIIDQDVQMHGVTPCPIKIKYLKSKFGSYHRKHHEITLNSYLARLDEVYLTYVLYHEYAHALVFNHSKAFYQVLDRFMPNHRIYQKALKKIAIQ